VRCGESDPPLLEWDVSASRRVAAYWGVPMTPEHRHLTAFRVPNGQYMYNRMAMGLKNSMHTYARLGDLAFGFLPPLPGSSVAWPSILGHNADLGTSLSLYVDDHCMSFRSFDQGYRFLHEFYFPRVARLALSERQARPRASSN
jgi:hypothetical protein